MAEKQMLSGEVRYVSDGVAKYNGFYLQFIVIISFSRMATGYPGKQQTSKPAAVDVS